MRKNKNRGYQKLRVWNDAIDYYAQTCDVFRGFPYELSRAASQAIASSDSTHRNTCPVKQLVNSVSVLWEFIKADNLIR